MSGEGSEVVDPKKALAAKAKAEADNQAKAELESL